MSDYKFLSTWKIEAPIGRVWQTLNDVGGWPGWWKGVVSVVELEPGDDNGVGSIRRTTWKSALPYKLEFDSEVIRVEHERYIEARAFGELEGVGIWHLMNDGGSGTRVDYDWRVKTTKPWMNAIAPLARPFFRWNHDVIMKWGEQGIKRHLAADANRD